MSNSGDMDFGAELKRGWEGFMRKPVELIVGMLGAQISMIVIVTIGPALLGMATAALRAVRGEDVEIGTAFEGYQNFVGALVLILLMIIAIGLGTIACILPGIALAIALQWSFYIMVDNPQVSAVDAMKQSVELAKGNIPAALVAVVVSAVLSMAGSAVMIGGIVTMPISMCMTAAIYDALIRAAAAGDQPVAETAPPAV